METESTNGAQDLQAKIFLSRSSSTPELSFSDLNESSVLPSNALNRQFSSISFPEVESFDLMRKLSTSSFQSYTSLKDLSPRFRRSKSKSGCGCLEFVKKSFNRQNSISFPEMVSNALKRQLSTSSFQSYTSLKDRSHHSRSGISSSNQSREEILIKNELLRKAAWAWANLLPMSSSRSNSNWVGGCLEFVKQKIRDMFGRFFRVNRSRIGVDSDSLLRQGGEENSRLTIRKTSDTNIQRLYVG
ncbi:hypothetical protein NE237_023323 [Protea cynaroides]|uniref:Uncharacterized protein n=1 Tax=Protea cynaroides TaxID=273540 RepID=A0A9Q0HGX6_9MAGN|nr:hypothetical protein NE237_023323 [Protea cynaroides]